MVSFPGKVLSCLNPGEGDCTYLRALTLPLLHSLLPRDAVKRKEANEQMFF